MVVGQLSAVVQDLLAEVDVELVVLLRYHVEVRLVQVLSTEVVNAKCS